MKDIASYRKALRRRLLRGSFVLGAGLIMLSISDLLILVSLPFMIYGIVTGLNALTDWIGLRRSIPVKQTKFSQLDISEIPRLAVFAIEEIGAYVYEDHLFLISDDVFYLEDLRRIEWLYSIRGGSRVVKALNLVISRVDKTRSVVMIPYSKETFLSPSQLWTQSQPNTERLLDWLTEEYPHIQTGHTKEQEQKWLSGQPLWKKFWELERAGSSGVSALPGKDLSKGR